jgi:hypothetical protein
MTTSDNVISETQEEFVQSWKFTDTCTNENIIKPQSDDVNSNLTNYCRNLYKLKTSYFASCFSSVDPDPFYEICIKLGASKAQDDESLQKLACISGVSYIEACSFENIPLRVPDSCIK